ncbi:N-acetylglucosamine-6-phosphate deacetylase [Virgibacillus sp. W0430]|uniref:N-acetylglucosamine-6-phosphate deacetylase n=1 Tax=Virgibacillus sp. W0430 TaxID=3391580 RepID=UPI003F4712AA
MKKNRPLIIFNVTVYTESTMQTNSSLLINDGVIQEILEHDSLPPNADIIDGTNLIALPGFIDPHIHGANGADVMDATEAAIDTIASALPREGTTSFLATTITQAEAHIENALINVGSYFNKENQAQMLGIHLEGPFIEKDKKGAQPEEHIIKPDLALFQKWQSLASNKIKTITLAPEHDVDGGFITHLANNGIIVSAGHSAIAYTDLKKAVQQYGVRQITHLCNAMPSLHHRDVGMIGAAFLLPELYAEIIADNIHVSREMLQIIYNNIGSNRLILITDAMKAKGLADGLYELGGQAVTVKGKKTTLQDGTLAGSVLKMNEAAKFFFSMEGVTMHDIIKITSENAAKQLGIYGTKGSISVGKDADIVLLDQDFQVKYTICQGKIAYRGE